MLINISSLVTIGALMLTVSAHCAGQRAAAAPTRNLADSTVPGIMKQARTSFPYVAVVNILRDRVPGASIARRTELADSIIRLAISTPGATLAIAALGAAGHPASGPEDPGRPEPRALEWLIRVHREGQDNAVRRSAVRAMADQVEPSRALPYLRSVATDADDPTAWVALAELIDFAFDPTRGSPSERAERLTDLRRLWDQGLVKERQASDDFKRFAFVQGWFRPRLSPGPSAGHN